MRRVTKKTSLLLIIILFLIALLPSLGCGTKFATYENTTYGFSIDYPEGWVKEETGTQAPILVLSAAEGLPVVMVLTEYLTRATTLEEYATLNAQALEEVLAQFEVVSEGEVLIGDTTGYELVFTWVQYGTWGKGKVVFLIRGTQAFIIWAYSERQDFDQNRGTIDRIIYSFRLEEPAPYGIPRSECLTLYDTGPITLDPALSREAGSHLYIVQIFSGLVSFDQSMQIVPEIAESWEVSDDGLTYTFYLRDNVFFHDGTPVTADDFKYSMERACDPQTGSQTARTYLGDIVGAEEMLAGEADEISGIRVIDDRILEITIDAPRVYFLAKLTYPVAFVVNRENVESGGEWWRNPNGTGPFKLKVWEEDGLLILERNDLYYLEPANVEYIVFRLWGGVPIRMYETGEIDVAAVGLGDIDRVMDPRNPLHDELEIFPELSLVYIGFNTQEPPFDDPNVRQAFCLAVDKEKIIELVLRDTVELADGLLPPGMPGYNEALRGWGFDPDLALELIGESSYGSVSNLPPITITTYDWGGDIAAWLGAAINEWRVNLGVEVEVRQLEPEDYFYLLMEEKDEMFHYGWIADYPDPQGFLDILFHSEAENNIGEYSNPELDVLLEAAAVETDEATRIAKYQQAEQMLVDDAAFLPFWFGKSYVLVKPYVEGYYLSPLGIPILKYVSIEPH